MTSVYQNILNRLDTRHAVLFLGAGSTVNCKRPGGGGGLTGYGLAEEIVKELVGPKNPIPIPRQQMPNLMEAAEYFQYNHPGARNALDQFLQSRLKNLQPTLGHYLATSFPWKAVITTNYNTVAEDAWSEATNHGFARDEAITIRTDADISTFAGETTKIRIYKPHGCVNLQMDPNNRMVLTSEDYALSGKLRAQIYAAIRSLSQTSTTVFVGYSLGDYTFRNLYYQLLLELGVWSHHSYSVAPIDPPILLEWKAKAMAGLKTTLLNTTFDVFMLNLVLARGSLHQDLKDRLKAEWGTMAVDNLKHIGSLALSDFQALPLL